MNFQEFITFPGALAVIYGDAQRRAGAAGGVRGPRGLLGSFCKEVVFVISYCKVLLLCFWSFLNLKYIKTSWRALVFYSGWG